MDHSEEIKHPEPDVAVRWAYSNCMAVLRERITYGEGAELSGGFADEATVLELTRTVTNYLVCERPALDPPPFGRALERSAARSESRPVPSGGS